MKRNRHCAETFYVCIFFFYFPFISLLFYWFLDAIVAEKHLVVSKLVFQPFLCSSSLYFHIRLRFGILCFFLRLRFMFFSMFVLSVCLQMHPMGLVFTCNAYFFIGAYFCFLWLAGHCLIGCDHRGNTFAMVFIQYSHFFLLFLPFFSVWE